MDQKVFVSKDLLRKILKEAQNTPGDIDHSEYCACCGQYWWTKQGHDNDCAIKRIADEAEIDLTSLGEED